MRLALCSLVAVSACSGMPAERPMPAVKDPASASAPGVERGTKLSPPAPPPDAPDFSEWRPSASEEGQGGQGGGG